MEFIVVIHHIDVFKPQATLVDMAIGPLGHAGAVLRLRDVVGVVQADMTADIDVCAGVDPGPVLLVTLI